MKPSTASTLTFLISAFLLLEGVWRLFSPVVYGILPTNRAQAFIHLVLGVAGFVARRRGAIKGYFGFLGSLLVVVAVLWFVPVTRDVPEGLLKINLTVAMLNFAVGLIALAVAVTENGRRRFGVPPSARSNPPYKV